MRNQHLSKFTKVTTAFIGTIALSTLILTNQAQADIVSNNKDQNSGQVQKNTNLSTDPIVKTNIDKHEKPNNDYWPNPNKYKDDAPVQILGINDLHGNIDTTGHAWVGKRNYQNAGGADRLAGYLNNAENNFKQKNSSGTTFRVQAGDMVGASPATSALLQDEPTLKALKAMGINIGTLGNHEFDEGLDEFHRALTGQAPQKGKFNSVEMNYPHEDSKMQIVIANITKKSDGKIPFNWQPYVVKDVKASNGAKSKIAFIGIDTSDLANLTFAKNVAPYNVKDEADAIAQYDRELRSKGINAIVVLAHTGVSTYKGKTTGDAVDILKKLYKIDPNNSVDIYVAAHSHQYADATVGHTKLVQANRFAMAYDDVIGYIDPKTNDFVPGSLISHVYPVMSEKDSQKYDPEVKITPDAKVAAIIQDAQKRTRAITDKPLVKVESKKDISKDTLGFKGESPVGKLLLEGQLYEAARQGKPADFAITNSGGIRSDLRVNKENGNVIWKDAQAVQPFGNRLEVVEITGDQLYKALNAQYQVGKNLGFEVGGMTYVYTDTPNDQQYPHKVALIYDKNDKLIDKNKTYKLIISNYLAGWKDVFGGLKVDSELGIDTDLFVQYLEDIGKQGKSLVTPAVNGVKTKKSQKEIEQMLAIQKANGTESNQPSASSQTSESRTNLQIIDSDNRKSGSNENAEVQGREGKHQSEDSNDELAASDSISNTMNNEIHDTQLNASKSSSPVKVPPLSYLYKDNNNHEKRVVRLINIRDRKTKLPQTGNKSSSIISVIGLAFTTLISAFAVVKKRKLKI